MFFSFCIPDVWKSRFSFYVNIPVSSLHLILCCSFTISAHHVMLILQHGVLHRFTCLLEYPSECQRAKLKHFLKPKTIIMTRGNYPHNQAQSLSTVLCSCSLESLSQVHAIMKTKIKYTLQIVAYSNLLLCSLSILKDCAISTVKGLLYRLT